MSDGWPDASTRAHTLQIGTRVGGVEITGLIGEGGFGIVYLAWDPSLQRRVAVKEYMPSSLATRSGNGAEVTIKSERHRETFEAGRKSFVNEARLLARFDHPGLVKVYRFWEAHGTAYMMMPYYEGPTLKAELDRRDLPPDETLLRSWLEPLLDALALIHAASCFHRDIAPDNIILGVNGPLLLDFGAARRVIGDMTHALTVVLKPGYAPIEQYGESARMQQGAWTDLYALGCVLHYAITGRAPMSSVERLMDDALVPLSRVATGSYSPRFLQAVDALLAVRPQNRPQDVAQFRALLGTVADELPAPVEIADTTRSVPTPVPAEGVPRSRSGVLAAAGLCAIALAAGTGWLVMRRAERPTMTAAQPGVKSTDTRKTAPAQAAARPAAPASPIAAAPVAASADIARSAASAPSMVAASEPASKVASAPASAAAFHDPSGFSTPHAASGAPSADAVPVMIKHTPSKSSASAAVRGAASSSNPAVAHSAAASSRCSEILQKASLEALSASESDFLKRECR